MGHCIEAACSRLCEKLEQPGTSYKKGVVGASIRVRCEGALACSSSRNLPIKFSSIALVQRTIASSSNCAAICASCRPTRRQKQQSYCQHPENYGANCRTKSRTVALATRTLFSASAATRLTLSPGHEGRFNCTHTRSSSVGSRLHARQLGDLCGLRKMA